jgi:hypothetical protein
MRKTSLLRPALAFGAVLLASPLYAQQNGGRDPLGRYGSPSTPAAAARGYSRMPAPVRRPPVTPPRQAMRSVHDYYPGMRRGYGPNYNVPTLRSRGMGMGVGAGRMCVPGRTGLMGR